jgi:hypothetical protein
MFGVEFGNGEERDEELGERKVRPVCFVRVVVVEVRAGGFFGRAEADSVVNSPKGFCIAVESPNEMEPADA